MEYYHKHSTKPKLSSAMRFFGSKHRKQQQQQQQTGVSSRSEALEARTDVANPKVQSTKDNGMRDGGSSSAQAQQQQQQQPQSTRPQSSTPTKQRSKGLTQTQKGQSPRQQQSETRRKASSSSPKFDRRTGAGIAATSTTDGATSPPNRSALSPNTTAAAATTAKKPPPTSILHKPLYGGQQQTPPPPPNHELSPLPTFQMSHNPRVRFLSASESVASEATSQVHLMAGANSVASSSCMSSSADKDNVFDRVLNMVMAEEHERLNAMGMSTVHHQHHGGQQQQEQSQIKQGKVAQQQALQSKYYSNVDAKARATLASVGGDSHDDTNGSDDDLGLLPPSRNELAPIDIDTGLEIGEEHLSPIDMDTGLEITENDYHDRNDEEGVEEELYNNGVKGLNIKSQHRARSYDSSSRQKQQQCNYRADNNSPSRHNRSGSDPEKQTHSSSMVTGGGGDEGTSSAWPASPSLGWGSVTKKKSLSSVTSKQQQQPPTTTSSSNGNKKKSKKFWDKKDFETDEWVAFGNQGSSSNKNKRSQGGGGGGKHRVSDLATF